MNLLITPALKMSEEERKTLEQMHRLFFLEDERISLSSQPVTFDPEEIEGIICNLFFLNNPLSIFPNLRYIQLTSAGMDKVPVEEIKKKNIHLENAGAVYAIPMAEWAVCKILDIYKQTTEFYVSQQQRQWEKRRTIKELYGATAAVIGFGNVGKKVAERLRSFGVTVYAVDVVEDHSGLSDRWFHIDEIQRALSAADIVLLTLPLMKETHHIIDDRKLAAMKDDAIIINISRGMIIDENALIRHLQKGRFSAAALDVFEKEPLPESSLLWEFDRVILSPHNSFVGDGNHKRLFEQIRNNLDQFIKK